MKRFFRNIVLIAIAQYLAFVFVRYTKNEDIFYIEKNHKVCLKTQEHSDIPSLDWQHLPKGKWLRYHDKNDSIEHRFCAFKTSVLQADLHKYMETKEWLIVEGKESQEHSIPQEAIVTSPRDDRTKKGKQLMNSNPTIRYWILSQRTFDLYGPYDNQQELQKAMKEKEIKNQEWKTI